MEEPRAFVRLVQSDFGFAFQHFAATVKAGGADVVAKMHFARGRLNG